MFCGVAREAMIVFIWSATAFGRTDGGCNVAIIVWIFLPEIYDNAAKRDPNRGADTQRGRQVKDLKMEEG